MQRDALLTTADPLLGEARVLQSELVVSPLRLPRFETTAPRVGNGKRTRLENDDELVRRLRIRLVNGVGRHCVVGELGRTKFSIHDPSVRHSCALQLHQSIDEDWRGLLTEFG